MTSKKEIPYLFQMALPFIALAWFKSSLFLIPILIIYCALPFEAGRKIVIKNWQKLGETMGRIISPIVLSFIYFVFLTPLAYLRRLIGSDELHLKRPEQSTLKVAHKENLTENFNDLW